MRYVLISSLLLDILRALFLLSVTNSWWQQRAIPLLHFILKLLIMIHVELNIFHWIVPLCLVVSMLLICTPSSRVCARWPLLFVCIQCVIPIGNVDTNCYTIRRGYTPLCTSAVCVVCNSVWCIWSSGLTMYKQTESVNWLVNRPRISKTI